MSGRRLAAGLLLLTLALAGCGGSTESSSQSKAAASWADGLCNSLVNWQTTLQSATSGESTSKTIQQIATAFPKANSKLKADLQALGKPPTTGATAAKSAVTDLSVSLNSNTQTIQTAISGVSGAQDLPAAVAAISGAVAAMGDELTSTRNQLQSLSNDDPWKKAFEDSDACQKLSSD